MRFLANFGTQTRTPVPASSHVHPNISTRRADTHLSCNGDEKEKRRGFAEAPPAAKTHHIIAHTCERATHLHRYPRITPTTEGRASGAAEETAALQILFGV